MLKGEEDQGMVRKNGAKGGCWRGECIQHWFVMLISGECGIGNIISISISWLWFKKYGKLL